MKKTAPRRKHAQPKATKQRKNHPPEEEIKCKDILNSMRKMHGYFLHKKTPIKEGLLTGLGTKTANLNKIAQKISDEHDYYQALSAFNRKLEEQSNKQSVPAMAERRIDNPESGEVSSIDLPVDQNEGAEIECVKCPICDETVLASGGSDMFVEASGCIHVLCIWDDINGNFFERPSESEPSAEIATILRGNRHSCVDAQKALRKLLGRKVVLKNESIPSDDCPTGGGEYPFTILYEK